MGRGLLSNEVDSWMTGVNSNVEGKQTRITRIIARYSGSAPSYRKRCEEVAADGYRELAGLDALRCRKSATRDCGHSSSKMPRYARAMLIAQPHCHPRWPRPWPRHWPRPPKRRNARAAGRLLMAIGLLCPLLLLPLPAGADWLGTLVGTASKLLREGAPTTPSAMRASRALDGAAAHIKTLPPKPEATVLAAESTQEGHWRFVNKAGEIITVGTPEEMKRVVSLLVPDAKPEARLTLYLTEDSVFARRASLKDLPRGSELNLCVGDESYRLLRRSEGASERLFAEIRSNLVVELSDPNHFAEAAWQLARPLNKASLRVLALEAGGATHLAASPRIDPVSKKALIDSVDPASLAAALGAVRGQTALVAGRVEGELLHFKGASGPERSLLVKDLVSAAEQADVNLVMLHVSSTPRQPGGRNWLWQKVEVKGLEEALQRARVADFYNALATPNSRYAVTAKPLNAQRTLLQISPIADLPRVPASRPLSDVLGDAAASLTGRLIMAGVEANIRSAEHQRDVDWRLLAGVPARVQFAYLVLLLIGLVGAPLARAWWEQVWPREDPAEYADPRGYWAARLLRATLFALVFLPLTAAFSAPLNLGRQIRDAALAPIRAWRWLRGGGQPTRQDAAARRGSAGEDAGSRLALGTPLDAGTAAEAASLGNYRPSR
jgi:hypothetical protein